MKRIFGFLLLSIAFFSCTENEDEIFYSEISVNVTHKTLAAGEEFTIKSISDLPITYQSQNNYHATVEYVDTWDNAVIRARYVGETVIKITNGEDTQEVHLIISPQSYLFPTPPLDIFGNSKQEVIALLGTPYQETENSVLYQDYSENAPYIDYLFNNENKLYSIKVTYKVGRAFSLDNYLNERYRFAGIFSNRMVGNGFVFYNSLSNETPTIGVYVYGLDQDHDAVVYQPYIEETEETDLKTSF